MDSRSFTMVICGFDGLEADVAETVDASVFFFPNQFIVTIFVLLLCTTYYVLLLLWNDNNNNNNKDLKSLSRMTQKNTKRSSRIATSALFDAECSALHAAVAQYRLKVDRPSFVFGLVLDDVLGYHNNIIT